MNAKDKISFTLVRMLETMELKEIQINEIAYESGYNRKTIQRNFESKEGILTYYLEVILEEFDSNLEDEIESVIEFFDYLYNFRSLILLLKKRKLLFILEKSITKNIEKEIINYFTTQNIKELTIENRYMQNIAIYQVVAIFKTWLEYNFDDDIEYTKKIIRKSMEDYEKW